LSLKVLLGIGEAELIKLLIVRFKVISEKEDPRFFVMWLRHITKNLGSSFMEMSQHAEVEQD
jgi:hypothetical protein